MKSSKNIFIITSLIIILSFNLVFATSEISGDNQNNSGGTSNSSGEITTTSGEIQNTSGENNNSSSGEETTKKILNSIAHDSEHSIYVNTSLTSSMTATKSGEESYDFRIITLPIHGNVSQLSLGSAEFSYTPSGDYEGKDSFTFRLESGEYYSNIGTVSISITKPKEPVIPFNYQDMQEHWANFSASHLASLGLIIGEEIGNKYYYCPDKTLTRGEFLLFLLATLEIGNEEPTANIEFADENEIPKWMLNKLKLAYEMKIISGKTDSQNKLYISPNEPITRAEAIVMINNALLSKTDTKDTEKVAEYTDTNEIPSWAKQSINNLTAFQIIQGTTDNHINPTKKTTRGEAAELCYKLYKQIEKNNEQK